MVIGILIGIALGICLTIGITVTLIVNSNYLGDKKGNRFDYGDQSGAYYYDKKNKHGDVRFHDGSNYTHEV